MMNSKKSHVAPLITVLILCCFLPCWSQKQDQQKIEISTKIYDKIHPVVARISCENGNKVGSGAVIGFGSIKYIIKDTIKVTEVAFVLTACHVVTKNYIEVFKQHPKLKPQFYDDISIALGEELKLKKGLVLTDNILSKDSRIKKSRDIFKNNVFINEYYDIKSDLALLICTSPTKKETIKYDYSEAVKPLQIVAAIGYPKGDTPTFTKGAINRVDKEYLITNAEIIGGNSGGPLIDKYGRMIGIVTQKINNEGQALKMNIILEIVPNWLDELKSYGILQQQWQRQKYAKFIHRLWQDPKFITCELLGLSALSYTIFRPVEPDLPGPPSFPTNPK